MTSTKIIIFISCIFAHFAIGHKTLLGDCPQVKPVNDLNMEKLEGLWYVIESFDSDEKCLTWIIKRIGNTSQWTINENTQSGLLYNIGWDTDDDSITEAVLTPQQNKNGSFWIKWSLNAASYDLTVYYTDYEMVIGLFACQELFFGHREQGLVLTRDPIPPKRYSQIARGKIASLSDINLFHYNKVDHSDCKYNVDLEGELLKNEMDHGPLGRSYRHGGYDDGLFNAEFD